MVHKEATGPKKILYYTHGSDKINYKNETFKDCTSAVENKVERKYFDIRELISEPNVQMCSAVEERVDDTTIDTALDNKDEFMWINQDTNYYKTKKKHTDSGYNKETI